VFNGELNRLQWCDDAPAGWAGYRRKYFRAMFVKEHRQCQVGSVWTPLPSAVKERWMVSEDGVSQGNQSGNTAILPRGGAEARPLALNPSPLRRRASAAPAEELYHSSAIIRKPREGVEEF
jgi:hypothetical protein